MSPPNAVLRGNAQLARGQFCNCIGPEMIQFSNPSFFKALSPSDSGLTQGGRGVGPPPWLPKMSKVVLLSAAFPSSATRAPLLCQSLAKSGSPCAIARRVSLLPPGASPFVARLARHSRAICNACISLCAQFSN
jgi:hypothetical protein